MDRASLKRLEDILNCVLEIESFMENRPREFGTFCNDTLLRRAVERNTEIIGEAMHKILTANPSVPISSAQQLVDARNYIIHAYDSLSADILWSIVINHLPLLKSEVAALLDEE